jgi:hypothetical protein
VAVIVVVQVEMMRTLGAEAHVCPTVPFDDDRHYYHVAEQVSKVE